MSGQKSLTSYTFNKSVEDIKLDIDKDKAAFTQLNKDLAELAKLQKKVNEERLKLGDEAYGDMMTANSLQEKMLKAHALIGSWGKGNKFIAEGSKPVLENMERIKEFPLNLAKSHSVNAVKRAKTFGKVKAKFDKAVAKGNGQSAVGKYREKEEMFVDQMKEEYERQRIEELKATMAEFMKNEMHLASLRLNANSGVMAMFRDLDIAEEAKETTKKYFNFVKQ